MSQHFVGTEHLLLGMISVGKGRGVEVLQKLGLNLEAIRDEIEVAVGTGPSAIPPGRVPYTPRSRKVLELAAKEAKMLAKSYMGTEHILLGLLHENQGVAGRVLSQHGISLDQVRQEIHKMDDGRGADADDKP